METKGINSNQLKAIALVAMTIDHISTVIWPNYPTDWWILLLHVIGRLAAPIFWFMIAEGYHYTHNLKKYGIRLLIFAVIGHFAYNFAFGIPFVPFQTGVFNQTSVIWPLFLGLIGLWVSDQEGLKTWQRNLIILLLTILAFCADWSSIAVLAVIRSIECSPRYDRYSAFGYFFLSAASSPLNSSRDTCSTDNSCTGTSRGIFTVLVEYI